MYLEKRGEKWRVLIRRKGRAPISKTFRLKAMAEKWARETEVALDAEAAGRYDPTVGEVVTDYLKAKPGLHPTTKAHARRVYALLGGERVSRLTGARVQQVFAAEGVPPSVGNKVLALAQAALRLHEAMHGKPLPLAAFTAGKRMAHSVGLARSSKHRERRVTDAEIAAVKAAVRYTLPFGDLIDMAVLTCLRLGELLNMRWADVDLARGVVLIRDRKHPTHKLGNHGLIPLLNGAAGLIAKQPRGERVFPYHPKSVQNLWMAATKKAGLIDLHLHDLRHEGISRLFEQGYGVAEVAVVSGHRDWSALRRYVQLRPESLHGGPLGVDR